MFRLLRRLRYPVLLVIWWAPHLVYGSLGTVTLENDLPRPVRITVAYNVTAHMKDPGVRAVNDIRVEEALLSPGQARDWTLGLLESTDWEVINIRVEPLPSQVVSVRLPVPPPSDPAAQSFQASPASFSAPFPYESGCDPSTAARLSITFETLPSPKHPYSRIVLVNVPTSPHPVNESTPLPPPPPPSALPVNTTSNDTAVPALAQKAAPSSKELEGYAYPVEEGGGKDAVTSGGDDERPVPPGWIKVRPDTPARKGWYLARSLRGAEQ